VTSDSSYQYGDTKRPKPSAECALHSGQVPRRSTCFASACLPVMMLCEAATAMCSPSHDNDTAQRGDPRDDICQSRRLLDAHHERRALGLLHDVQNVLCHDVCGQRHRHGAAADMHTFVLICNAQAQLETPGWIPQWCSLSKLQRLSFEFSAAECVLGALQLNVTLCGAVVIAIQCSGQLMDSTTLLTDIKHGKGWEGSDAKASR
jgi:hypothetical protein